MALKPLLYQNDHAGSISYLVYIGGIEIPSMGFGVSYGVWEIPQAQIRLVPDPILHRLGAEDRIPVQCFYLDQWQHSPPQYCLMFDGEIVAWGSQHTPGGRALSFTCVDYIAILTQTFFFFMSTFDDFAVGTSAGGIGVAASGVQTPGFGALYPYSLFAQGLADPGNTDSTALITRPIDYAYNIIRALIKLQHPNRAVPATNFFAPWTQRTAFHRRWVATPYFDQDPVDATAPGLFPILKAAQDEQAIAAIARQAAQAANGSLWSMLQEILRTVLCEIGMLPTPAAVKSDFTTLLPRGAPTTFNQGADAVFLTQYFVKPQTYYSLPPVCNVFFPSQIMNSAYQEDYATQPTRAYYNESAITGYLANHTGNAGAGETGLNTLMQDAMTTGYPEEVDIAIRDARDAALQNGKNMLVYPEEYYRGPVVLRKQLPRWFAFILDAQREASPVTPTTVTSATRSGGGVNNVSSFSSCEGGPVYFGGTDNPDNFLQQLRITEFAWGGGRYDRDATETERRIILDRSIEQADPGECVPPQIFPLSPPNAWAGFASGYPVPRFWSIRRGTTVHGGHDLTAPQGTSVVSVTEGVVESITSASEADANTTKNGQRSGVYLKGTAGRGGLNVSTTMGNAVVIKDDKGGLHRYLHLYDVGSDITVGARVTVGKVLGVVGNTGRSVGFHLHYDVIDSSRKFRMPYPQRLAQLARLGSRADLDTPDPATSAEPPHAESGGGTQPSGPSSSGANTSSAGGITSDVSSADTTRNLFRLYAKCDYYTERYGRRNGTLSMPFNPYPIPGFGCAAFDRRTTGLDTIGYLTNVQHEVSANGWGTTVSYSQGRTFQEMFALMQRDTAVETARLARDYDTITAAINDRYARANDRLLKLVAEHPDLTPWGQQSLYVGFMPPGIEWISPIEGAPMVGAPEAPTPPTGEVPGDVDQRLGEFGRLSGDVRVAPAEPLEEIRQLQDVERADAFYRAMFWQDNVPPSTAELNEEDAAGAIDEARATGGRGSSATLADVRDQQANGGGVTRADVAENLRRDEEQARRATREGRTAAGRRARRARISHTTAFRQEDIVRMVDGTESTAQAVDIQTSGLSASTTSTAMRLVRKAFTEPFNMTDLEMQQLASIGIATYLLSAEDGQRMRDFFPRKKYENGRAAGDAHPGQTYAYVPCPADQLRLLTFLRSMEQYFWTQTSTTNVRGDVYLVPTEAAAPLFESYTAAMGYNTRPVCTLDEYLWFLGPGDGDYVAVPENLVKVQPSQSNLGQNDYLHPAHYYKVIRTYVQGPPRGRGLSIGAALAAADTTNPATPPHPGAPVPAPTATASAAPAASNAPAPATQSGPPRAEMFPLALRNPDAHVDRLIAAYGAGTFYSSVFGGSGLSDARKAYYRAIMLTLLDDNQGRVTSAAATSGFSSDTQVNRRIVENLRRALVATRSETDAQGSRSVQRIPWDISAPFLAGMQRPQAFMAPLPLDADNQTADRIVQAEVAQAAVQRDQIRLEAENARDQAERHIAGPHTIQVQYVAGLPAGFPQARANWESVLLRYRDNVLQRDDPRG